MSKLAGKIAVVTGSTSGIGKGIASAFAREGASVVVADLVEESLAAEVLVSIREYGGEALFTRTDVSDADSVRVMAEQAIARFGRVDILVNNAGIFTESLVENMSIENWDRVVNTNLRGTFLCTRALIGQMLARGNGRIINIASQLGQIGGEAAGHYAASKAGVIGFTKSLAREVCKRGVLVNAIAPGPIETPLLDSETEEWRSGKLAQLPIGRFGLVDEVTPTAVLLASAGGSYYVGQTLGPNGGDVML
ncbi:3-oxoacyl-ACP reductase family protein [Paraburkholderia sp. RL17-337-BIB-A]|uniref:3-oxoacyl-ACP reductase family protein n=1 Tax=Paraburkholderia sp. RL17-337-BIB-A TaxID=3031636 RepID=UPI0038BC4C32